MYNNLLLKIYSRLPFERYLRCLLIDNYPTQEIKETLEEWSGFKVPNDSFLPNFKERMIRSSEVVKNFFEKKPERNTIAFKSCLTFLEIEEFYNTANLDDQTFGESWLNEIGNFASLQPKPACMANIFKARGKSIEEIQDMLLRFFAYDVDLETLKKYFYYFFETSWMNANYYQFFARNQCEETFAYLYQLISEQEEEKILWAFDKDRPRELSKLIEREIRYSLPIYSKEARELGKVSEHLVDFLGCIGEIIYGREQTR